MSNDWKNNLNRSKYNELMPDDMIDSYLNTVKMMKESKDKISLSPILEDLKWYNGRVPEIIKELLDEEDLIVINEGNDGAVGSGYLGVHWTVDEKKYGKMINDFFKPEDLFEEYGIEEEPHVTVLYGFSPEVKIENIKSKMEDKCIFKKDIEFVNLSLFENEDFDVLKMDIKSDKLNNFNKFFKDNFPWQNDYDEYKPHFTVAYLKKGLGKYYASGHTGKDIIEGIRNFIKDSPLYYKFVDSEKNDTFFSIKCDK